MLITCERGLAESLPELVFSWKSPVVGCGSIHTNLRGTLPGAKVLDPSLQVVQARNDLPILLREVKNSKPCQQSQRVWQPASCSGTTAEWPRPLPGRPWSKQKACPSEAGRWQSSALTRPSRRHTSHTSISPDSNPRRDQEPHCGQRLRWFSRSGRPHLHAKSLAEAAIQAPGKVFAASSGLLASLSYRPCGLNDGYLIITLRSASARSIDEPPISTSKALLQYVCRVNGLMAIMTKRVV